MNDRTNGYSIVYDRDGMAIFGDRRVPAGTLSCGVLNISKENVAQMDAAAQSDISTLRGLLAELECVHDTCGDPPAGDEKGILDDLVCFRVYIRRFLNKYLSDEKDGRKAYARFCTDIDGLTAQLRREDALRRTVFPRELEPVLSVICVGNSVCERYSFPNLCQLLVFDQLRALEQDRAAKKCANCGRYFIPDRRNAGYCELPSPDDPERTCREVGARNAFIKRHEGSQAYKLCAAACSRIYTRKSRGSLDTAEAAELLKKCAALRDSAARGEITLEQLGAALGELTETRRRKPRSGQQ